MKKKNFCFILLRDKGCCFEHRKRLKICPVPNYMLQVNNSKTRARCEKCSKLTIKTPERLASGVFIVNFENIVLHIALVVLLLTLSR